MREPAATVSTAALTSPLITPVSSSSTRAAGVDVALDLAADDHGRGIDLAGDVRALLDRDVALHVDVALEAAGDADVARALDLALDGDVGGDQRFLGGAGRSRAPDGGWSSMAPATRTGDGRRGAAAGSASGRGVAAGCGVLDGRVFPQCHGCLPPVPGDLQRNGAGRGSRTPDLPLTRRLLYQLSYASADAPDSNRAPRRPAQREVTERGGRRRGLGTGQRRNSMRGAPAGSVAAELLERRQARRSPGGRCRARTRRPRAARSTVRGSNPAILAIVDCLLARAPRQRTRRAKSPCRALPPSST